MKFVEIRRNIDNLKSFDPRNREIPENRRNWSNSSKRVENRRKPSKPSKGGLNAPATTTFPPASILFNRGQKGGVKRSKYLLIKGIAKNRFSRGCFWPPFFENVQSLGIPISKPLIPESTTDFKECHFADFAPRNAGRGGVLTPPSG